ncbi:MAG: TlpA family protein disulfide reductase [Treponema sp.]|jgi:thiol-disulfide isomerase/thioredoxin|nr:TlpA family protein disulfide reductase [Treponema sp.]
MKKRFLIYGFIAVVCLQAIAAQSSIPASVVSAFQKARMPILEQSADPTDFTVPLLNGGTRKLSALRGKVVIFNIWATWCPPCRAEMPSMEALYQKYKNQGLEILAVDSGEAEQDVARFIRQNGFTFPVGLDINDKITEPYQTGYVPTSYIIDRKGKIISIVVGSMSWDTENVYKAFDALLAQ